MSEQESRIQPEQNDRTDRGTRTPIIFPAGDLDAMIFFEEYVVAHSER